MRFSQRFRPDPGGVGWCMVLLLLLSFTSSVLLQKNNEQEYSEMTTVEDVAYLLRSARAMVENIILYREDGLAKPLPEELAHVYGHQMRELQKQKSPKVNEPVMTEISEDRRDSRKSSKEHRDHLKAIMTHIVKFQKEIEMIQRKLGECATLQNAPIQTISNNVGQTQNGESVMIKSTGFTEKSDDGMMCKVQRPYYSSCTRDQTITSMTRGTDISCHHQTAGNKDSQKYQTIYNSLFENTMSFPIESKVDRLIGKDAVGHLSESSLETHNIRPQGPPIHIYRGRLWHKRNIQEKQPITQGKPNKTLYDVVFEDQNLSLKPQGPPIAARKYKARTQGHLLSFLPLSTARLLNYSHYSLSDSILNEPDNLETTYDQYQINVTSTTTRNRTSYEQEIKTGTIDEKREETNYSEDVNLGILKDTIVDTSDKAQEPYLMVEYFKYGKVTLRKWKTTIGISVKKSIAVACGGSCLCLTLGVLLSIMIIKLIHMEWRPWTYYRAAKSPTIPSVPTDDTNHKAQGAAVLLDLCVVCFSSAARRDCKKLIDQLHAPTELHHLEIQYHTVRGVNGPLPGARCFLLVVDVKEHISLEKAVADSSLISNMSDYVTNHGGDMVVVFIGDEESRLLPKGAIHNRSMGTNCPVWFIRRLCQSDRLYTVHRNFTPSQKTKLQKWLLQTSKPLKMVTDSNDDMQKQLQYNTVV